MSEHAEVHHPAQESDELPTRWLLLVVLGVTVLCFALGGWGCALARSLGPPIGGLMPDEVEPAAILRSSLDHELFDAGPGDFARRREKDRERLGEWGWVDRNRGLVHMPIDVAMRIHLREPRQETAAR